MSSNSENLSKLRAIKLWDSKKIEHLIPGSFSSLKMIHDALFYGIEGYQAGERRTYNISRDNFLFASSLHLPQALEQVEKMPQSTLDEIIDKYIEMNIAHPFIEGNGRSMRIWLDIILKNEIHQCIDWRKVDKQEYLDFMRLSPTNSKYIKHLLKSALTDQIHNREIFIKGIDKSYDYESLNTKSLCDLLEEESALI